jgi:hypothetical protein
MDLGSEGRPEGPVPLTAIEQEYLRNPVYINVISKTVRTAEDAYRLAQWLSMILFGLGVCLVVTSIGFGILRNESILTLFFGGLGATSIITLFLYRPIEKIQAGMADLIRSQLVALSFSAQYNILMRYLADNRNVSAEHRWKASDLMRKATSELVEALTFQQRVSENEGDHE